MKNQCRLFLDTSDDMMYAGKRHESFMHGKLYYNKSNFKMLLWDIEVYINGGHTTDLSVSVLEKLVCHAENCYHIPAIKVVGRVVKTN